MTAAKKGVVISCAQLPFLGAGSRFPSVGRDTISSGGKAMSTTIDVGNAAVFERRESHVRSATWSGSLVGGTTPSTR